MARVRSSGDRDLLVVGVDGLHVTSVEGDGRTPVKRVLIVILLLLAFAVLVAMCQAPESGTGVPAL